MHRTFTDDPAHIKLSTWAKERCWLTGELVSSALSTNKSLTVRKLVKAQSKLFSYFNWRLLITLQWPWKDHEPEFRSSCCAHILLCAVIYYEWPQLACPPRGCGSHVSIGWAPQRPKGALLWLVGLHRGCGRILSTVEVGYSVTMFIVDISLEVPWVRVRGAEPLTTRRMRLCSLRTVCLLIWSLL